VDTRSVGHPFGRLQFGYGIKESGAELFIEPDSRANGIGRSGACFDGQGDFSLARRMRNAYDMVPSTKRSTNRGMGSFG
jgi:hypothetical protein